MCLYILGILHFERMVCVCVCVCVCMGVTPIDSVVTIASTCQDLDQLFPVI